jgi:hypothetical protein
MHTDLFFNWTSGDSSTTTDAQSVFCPAQCRGDLTSTAGSATYGLPAWYFIAKAKEWEAVRLLYSELKPIKQYVTVKVLGLASNANQVKPTGGSQGIPRSGYEYLKLMLNADYISTANKDSQALLGQNYIWDFEKDQTTRNAWVQPGVFGNSGSGIGQSRPPSVSIQTAWPSDIEYVNTAYINSGSATS